MPTEVKGLVETRAKLEQVIEDLHGAEFKEGMQEAVLLVLRDAREAAPVDTGRLKNSITGEVTINPLTGDVKGIVGSNVVYAPYMELGTKPHWPPVSALQTWARRHGMNAFLVARAIARKGLKPRKFLQEAYDHNKPEIKRIVGARVTSIVGKK